MTTKKLVLMSMMLALLILSSKLVIPLPLLDFISIQIVIVYMLYPILGKYHSFLTLFLYLLIGLVGLPVFAAGGGILYVLRPSFGYLLAFLILPFIQDTIKKGLGKTSPTFTNVFMQNVICLVFIYLLGLSYKTVILLVVYGRFELFQDILLFSSLCDFIIDLGLTIIISLLMIKLNSFQSKPEVG